MDARVNSNLINNITVTDARVNGNLINNNPSGSGGDARGMQAEDVDWGRRSVLSPGGWGGSGGVQGTDVRGSGRGGEDMAEAVPVGLERHPASESPSVESELVEPEGERDGGGGGGREESDSRAPRSARRWTASLGAAPHSSAWPTILGRGPVSLIEKFPVSSPDGGGDDDVRGSGEGGAGAGGEAIHLPVRGDGTSNVYHPYISNTLLPIANTSAAPSPYTSSVYMSRSGVAKLLQSLTSALVQHLSRAPTFLHAQLSGGECIRLLIALALLQHPGSRACYQVLARRLLQLIDTLSPHQLCDVLWSLAAQAAAPQSTRLPGAGMAAAATTSESVSAETASTEGSAGGAIAAAEGGGWGFGRVGRRGEEEGEEEVVEEDVLSRLFVEVSHRLFGWEEEEELNEEEETLRETQREMECDAASHWVRGRIAATSLESLDDGQGEGAGEGEGEGEEALLCGELAPDGGGCEAQARFIQARAAALSNNAHRGLMHLLGAEDAHVALAAAAESRGGEGGFVALMPGTPVMQLATHELADLAVAVAVAAHPSLRKSPAMQRICERMMWGLRVRTLLMTSGRSHPRPPSSPPPPPADVEAEDALAFCWAFARMGMLDEVMVRDLSRAVALRDQRRAANVTQQLDADGWQPFSKVLYISAVYRKYTRTLTFEIFFQGNSIQTPFLTTMPVRPPRGRQWNMCIALYDTPWLPTAAKCNVKDTRRLRWRCPKPTTCMRACMRGTRCVAPVPARRSREIVPYVHETLHTCAKRSRTPFPCMCGITLNHKR
jgi:hypothetical protein